jgi:hypothetical protein
MNNKRQKSRYRWPYNKHRMGRIETADRLAKEAGEVAASLSGDIEKGSEPWMAARRCARKFERAGSLYAQAGLCAAAVVAFNGAATCWQFAGEEGHANGCREAASSIDVFYS